MKLKRHPRHAIRLKGKVTSTQSAVEIQILTIGVGGCGFWVSEKESSKIKTCEIISCKLLLDSGKETFFKGEVLYSYPYPHEGQLGKSVGVKFVGDTDEIQRLLQSFEEMKIGSQRS